MSMLRHVERSRILAVTPERIWAALADPIEARSWLGVSLPEPLVPGQVRLDIDAAGGRRAIVIEDAAPEQRLRFRWTGDEGETSVVDIRLEQHAGGTRVSVSETAGADLAASGNDPALAEVARQ